MNCFPNQRWMSLQEPSPSTLGNSLVQHEISIFPKPLTQSYATCSQTLPSGHTQSPSFQPSLLFTQPSSLTQISSPKADTPGLAKKCVCMCRRTHAPWSWPSELSLCRDTHGHAPWKQCFPNTFEPTNAAGNQAESFLKCEACSLLQLVGVAMLIVRRHACNNHLQPAEFREWRWWELSTVCLQ
jgi:hypothetical protein